MKHPLWAQLDADGEDTVKVKYAQGEYTDVELRIVLEWFNQLSERRADAAEAKRAAREAAMLSAMRAASRWAMYAAITATVALIAATKDQIIALLTGQP